MVRLVFLCGQDPFLPYVPKFALQIYNDITISKNLKTAFCKAKVFVYFLSVMFAETSYIEDSSHAQTKILGSLHVRMDSLVTALRFWRAKTIKGGPTQAKNQ